MKKSFIFALLDGMLLFPMLMVGLNFVGGLLTMLFIVNSINSLKELWREDNARVKKESHIH